jgi:pimeloyl-ACP methyl ester carboxylesterase
MTRRLFAALAAGAVVTAGGLAAVAQTEAVKPNAYAEKAAWLCWPGRTDACSNDNTTTVIAADGAMNRETWAPAADPKVDCFYVYPTVSTDPGVISDMTANDEERRVVEQQLSRFASQCRVYAPLYRQFTLTSLRALVASGAPANAPRPTTPYDDVRDAWNHYLKHENNGRGVVLIGHSQGSGVLTQLIAQEIDGKPAQKQLISALLIGTNLPVEKGKDTGTFKSIPLCRSADQTGCAVSYVTFRDNVPPPPESRFGKPRDPASPMEVACVNPAAPAGGAAPLHAYMSTTGNGMDAAAWVKDGPKVETPFVSAPGLLTGECVSKDGFNYLSVKVNADPADARVDDIKGDVIAGGKVSEDWGLHLVDVNVAMGDLVNLVESQSKAWLAKQ